MPVSLPVVTDIYIYHNPQQTPNKSTIKCKKLKIQQKACI